MHSEPESNRRGSSQQSKDAAAPSGNGESSLPLKNNANANGESGDVNKKLPVITSIFSENDKEIIRLIGQHLQEMGLHKASETLMTESGCKLEHSITSSLREQVMGGLWKNVMDTLAGMEELVKHKRCVQKMRFFVLQQKYLELIEEGEFVDALFCLRNEIQPLNIYVARVHQLPSFLMMTNQSELLKSAEWEGKGDVSRRCLLEKLQSYLPMSVMMPPSRLKTLLSQALERQQNKCLYHNSTEPPVLGSYSLLLDHACHRTNFPSEEKQVIWKHTNEAWYCQFSNNGKWLATGSRDATVQLYKVDEKAAPNHKVTHNRTFQCHSSGVGFLSWSPDDRYIVACGNEESNEVMIFDVSSNSTSGTKISHSTEDSLVCCCWSSTDEKRFAVGGLKGQFYECCVDGSVIQTWEGVRVQALVSRPQSSSYLAADTQCRVRSYSFEDESDQTLLKESYPIISMNISSDGKFLLINLVNQGIHMWDLEKKVMIRKFVGSVQGGSYHVYSTFGGSDDEYIASGSEDGKVYIWHKSTSEQIQVLEGHLKVVNCVSWNKKIPSMMASVSDDNSLRIWGPSKSSEMDYEEEDEFEKDEEDDSNHSGGSSCGLNNLVV